LCHNLKIKELTNNLKDMKKLVLAAFAIAALASCKRENESEKNSIYKGPEVTVHGGKVWSWVKVDKNNQPVSIGVTIPDAVMNSVPIGDGQSMPDPGHMMDNMFTLQLPEKASVTPFRHIGLDWNPSGHEPAGVYTHPHFDFHFYTISKDERMTIPPYEVDSSKFKNLPAPSYMPALTSLFLVEYRRWALIG